MASSLGLVGQIQHPEVEANLRRVREMCVERGVPCVAVATSLEDAHRRIDEGFRIILTRLAPGIAGRHPLPGVVTGRREPATERATALRAPGRERNCDWCPTPRSGCRYDARPDVRIAVVSGVDGMAADEPTWQSRVVDRSMKRTEELARARALGSTKRIVEAAIELASESGGAGFTLQQVVDRPASRSRPSTGTSAARTSSCSRSSRRRAAPRSCASRRLAARETDPIGRMRVIMMTPFHTANRAVAGRLSATVSRELRRLREDYAEELAPLTAPYLALLEDAIRQVAATGRISPEDPHRDAELILGMAGAIFADVSTGSATYDRDAEEGYWWAFCLRALGADDGAARRGAGRAPARA